MNIRAMTASDLDLAAELVAAEHWLSETRETFEAFLAHDPHGCFVGEFNGERIGICIATAYDRHGFLGELIIIPAHRNRGYGESLLRHAMDYLTSRGCANMWLDGDLPAVPLYERLGFRTVGRSLRFLGRIPPQSAPGAGPMTADDLNAVIALDRAAFGDDRSFFLSYRFEHHPSLCRVLRRGGKVTGYVMAWPGNGVITVGPWVALPDEAQPVALLHDLAAVTGDLPLRFGVLYSNTRAVEALETIPTLQSTPHCLRMMIGPNTSLGTSAACLAMGSPAKG
jgi:predicted N-acetyltransferase YhbS